MYSVEYLHCNALSAILFEIKILELHNHHPLASRSRLVQHFCPLPYRSRLSFASWRGMPFRPGRLGPMLGWCRANLNLHADEIRLSQKNALLYLVRNQSRDGVAVVERPLLRKFCLMCQFCCCCGIWTSITSNLCQSCASQAGYDKIFF